MVFAICDPLSENHKILFCHKTILEMHRVKIHMLREKFVHALIVFICTKIKLKSIKPIYHWIRLFMESKKIFVSCLHSKGYVSYGYLFTTNIHHFLVGMAFFFVNTEEYRYLD